MRAVVGLLCALLWLGPAAFGQEPAAIRMTVDARSLQPGELVVVSLTAPPHVGAVTVTGFDQRATAYPAEGAAGAWQALIGIDLDIVPGSYRLVAEGVGAGATASGETSVTVVDKRFTTRTLKVAPEFVNPPRAVQARIAEESRLLQTAFDNPAPERLWRPPFVRPVPHRANSRFGSRSVFNGEPRNPHSGTDFLSPAGTPVEAPAGGRVVVARDLFFSGRTVVLDHGLGMFSLLAHLSRLDAKEGSTVAAGDRVGLVGATGRVTGAHLHWSLRVGGARVDPLAALALLGPPSP